MSALCGIVTSDGRPVEASRIRLMVAAGLHRSPDGRAHWIGDGVALGFGALHTASESSRGQQPRVDVKRGFGLCFAGRVDERQDLLRQLQANGLEPSESSGAELVLDAYARWGTDCLDKVRGEFSLALWDGCTRRLICARDLAGTRPLYYFQSKTCFYFASELRQLLALPEIPRRPNEGMIGEYLLSQMASKSETQYAGVMRLPPASYLLLEEDRVEVIEYWDPRGVPSIRYRRDEEYAEHLREILGLAVESQLLSDRPVGVQLSGGVDSSSVVAVAADLTRGQRTRCPSLEAFSLVFPGWDCDESEFIDAVEKRSGIPSHRLTPTSLSRREYSAQVGRSLDYPDYPNGTMSDSLERAAHERGIRVLLTGLGGDEWFQRADLYLADLLRKGRLIAAAEWVRSLPQASMMSFRRSPWFVDGVSPLVPQGVKDLLRKGRPRDPGTAFINPDFARRNDLQERLRQRLDWRPFGDLARAGSFRAATQGFQVHAIEMEERSAAGFHLELRHPFHDRRVVEFGLGLPPDQRWRHGLHKHVLREAMRDLLPVSVRQRSSKAEFSRVFVEALLAIGRDSFDRLGIAEAGWVDGRVVLGMFDKMEQRYRTESLSRGPELWPLWSVFGTELLYREVFNRNGSGD